MSEAARRFYDRWSRGYDLLATRAPGVRRWRAAAVEALDLSAGDVVLDLGCGTGANFPLLREAVGPSGTVVGVDLAPGMLARARDRVTRAGWENVHCCRGDATTLPVNGPVDGVSAAFVVGMLSDPVAAVDDWLGIARSGGRVALLNAVQSEHPVGRLLAPAFGAFVRAGSPPGSRRGGAESPAERLDRRVRAAHDHLLAETEDGHSRRFGLGYARVTAGTVR